MNTLSKTRSLVITAGLSAIIIIMAFVPFLGYIPLGFMNATIIHVPVIIGAILLGPKSGGFLGFIFGFTSLWKNTFMPNPTSFVFSPFMTIGGFNGNLGSLAVCFIPRILIGIVGYFVFKAVLKIPRGRKKKIRDRSGRAAALIAAGVVGSLTNTLLVMNMIYLFFGSDYAAASNKAAEGIYGVIIGIICIQGIPEAIISGVLTMGIAGVLLDVVRNEG